MSDSVEWPGREFLLYATEDGEAELEVRLIGESVWLSNDQMAELFQRNRTVIRKLINNVFSEGELDRDSVSAYSALTAADRKPNERSSEKACQCTATSAWS